MDALPLFEFLAEKASLGVRVALVTVTRVAGSSMRDPGAHMSVAEDGEWRGSLSGGCIEAAVVADARNEIAAGRPREIRFGAGSPYLDIRLPCGGSLDVLISPLAEGTLAMDAAALLAARTPFVLSLPIEAGEANIEPRTADWRTCREGEWFRVQHLPPLAVLIIGHGAAVEALHAQASAAGAVVRIMTPDREIFARLAARRAPVRLLAMPDDPVPLEADPWTAVAFLFHDHDWETALVAEALAGPAFYVGAMGSRTTQHRRAAALACAGASAEQIARLRAPIGLIHSSRDPNVLALSVLTEIVRDFTEATRRADLTSACRA